MTWLLIGCVALAQAERVVPDAVTTGREIGADEAKVESDSPTLPSGEPASEEAPPPEEEDGSTDPLVSKEFQQPTAPLWLPNHLLNHLLSAPEYLFELALAPLGAFVYAAEKYSLHERIPDLLQNEDGTIKVTPDLRISVGQGFGGGAILSFRSLTRDEGKLAFGAVARVNADRQFDFRTERRFSSIEGRRIAIHASIETDRDREWFGIGNDAVFDDRRTLKDETIDAGIEIDLTPRGSKKFLGVLQAGYLRQTLNPGEGNRAPPVGGDTDVVAPAGFEDSLDYANIGVELTLSSVDSVGRPTRGGILQLETTAAQDFDQGDLSAWTTEVRAIQYLQILPRNRVLAFKGGASAAVPLREGDEVPFAQLVSYGGNDILRGYRQGRWRDEWGWWGALEYSFPVYDFGGLGFELAPTFFFDVGRVGSEFDDLFEGSVRYSSGIGVRASHDLFFAFQVSLGFSPDGTQFNLNLGEAFF